MLSSWTSFYVMMGSSAAALTGLVFIVVTLISEKDSAQSDSGLSTYTTPTVVHFSCALLTSAVMAAPFGSLVPVAVILGLAGAAGMFYVVLIARRQAALENYRADMEDWTWNVVLPFIAYGTLTAGAIALTTSAAGALYAPAAAVALLIAVGIHNAWDVVTFLATGKVDALPSATLIATPENERLAAVREEAAGRGLVGDRPAEIDLDVR
jgi:hypothetical protein